MVRVGCPICSSKKVIFYTKVWDWFLETQTGEFDLWRCAGCGGYFLRPEPTEEDLAKAYPGDYWWGGGGDGLGRVMEWYRRLGARMVAGWIEKKVISPQVSPMLSFEPVIRTLRIIPIVFLKRLPAFSPTKRLFTHLFPESAAKTSSESTMRNSSCQRKRGGRLRVVELGSGVGTMLAVGRDRFGWEVKGVDFSKDASKAAKASYGVKVKVADLEQRLPDLKRFDVVVASHVLEHLRKPEEFLRNVDRTTKSDVRLVVMVPNAGSLGVRLFGVGWRGFDVPRHLRTYTLSGLKKQLREAGWEVENEKKFSFRDDAAHLAGSMVPEWDPIVMGVRNDKPPKWLRSLKCLMFGIITMGLQLVAYIEGILGMGETINVIATKSINL
jgi:SAM-dependent methyltransferase